MMGRNIRYNQSESNFGVRKYGNDLSDRFNSGL